MGFSFIPKEIKFFDLFDQQAIYINKAAAIFKELVLNGRFDDEGIARMRDIEHDCDNVTHDIIDKLNRTFITPFDREDIHALAHELDNVVDILYATSKRMRLYQLNVINQDMIKFSEIIEESIAHLAKALNGLRDSKNPRSIMDSCIEINRLENVGDLLRDAVIGELFNNVTDPITVIKWKEVVEGAETVLDICEDVANVIESILVKQG